MVDTASTLNRALLLIKHRIAPVNLRGVGDIISDRSGASGRADTARD